MTSDNTTGDRLDSTDGTDRMIATERTSLCACMSGKHKAGGCQQQDQHFRLPLPGRMSCAQHA